MAVSAIFENNDLVQIDIASMDLAALARVRDTSGGRLHIALEAGAYLPWVDADVTIRRYGEDAALAHPARILHAGTSTALLELVLAPAGEERREPPRDPPGETGAKKRTSGVVPAFGAAPAADDDSRNPLDTLPLIDEGW